MNYIRFLKRKHMVYNISRNNKKYQSHSMYKNKNFKSALFFVCILLIGVQACKKKDYLTDTGVHDPVTPLNNYDYLAINQLHQFDTTLIIIDKLGLKDEVNNAATFFAPTDYSILKTINARLTIKQQVNPAATYTLDSLIKSMSQDSLRMYMFDKKITLDNAPEFQAQPYTSLGKTNQGVIKVLQTGSPYIDRTSAPTYLLFFVKVRGALDIPGITPPLNENDISVLCQTTGILTSNGATILHVLNNNHFFITF